MGTKESDIANHAIKYKKKRADKLQFADNEIFVKGNTQNVRKFVERAIGLLQGMEVKTRKPKTNEDDEKEEVEYDVKTLKFDTIHLFGGNRAMGAVVSLGVGQEMHSKLASVDDS